jgi:hypothetical protein
MKRIDKKIVGQQVLKADSQEPVVVKMHESLERPSTLNGSTYKIKTPLSDHAIYVTINNITLNEGTEYEKEIPFEIFVNSKSNDHFQWVTALTRVMSAVFRKGGDVTFLVEELKSVFDPHGGYLGPGGKFRASLVAELGYVIEAHLESIGMLKKPEIDENVKKYLQQKKEEYIVETEAKVDESGYPSSAQICKVCQIKAVVNTDGCMTCLACGDSKCG